MPSCEADVAGGAPGFYLLGQVKERLQLHDQAGQCYAKCLELCPLMWCAFKRLSWLSLSAAGAAGPAAASLAGACFSDERMAACKELYYTML